MTCHLESSEELHCTEGPPTKSQNTAPNQEPKLGNVTLTVQTESFRALPNDFGQLKLLAQVTLLLQPMPFPVSSSCRHLSNAIQPSSYWEANILAWQDPCPAGAGHCAPKSSIPVDRVLCRIPTPAAPRASDLLLLFFLCSVPGVSPRQQTRLWADKSLWEGGVYLDIKCFSLLVRGSCCFPLAGQSMPSPPGLRQFGADCLQSAWLPLFSWVFWCMILENQRQDLSS